MTYRERTLAFAGAATVVIGTLGFLTLVAPPRAPERPRATVAAATQDDRRRATIRDPFAVEATPTPSDGEEPGEVAPRAADATPQPASGGTVAEAKRAALAFLAVYLRYEIGDVSPRVRKALIARADDRFAHALLVNPPRPPRSGGFPEAARVVRVDDVKPATTDDGLHVVVAVRRDGERSTMAVTVERRRGQWVASAIG